MSAVDRLLARLEAGDAPEAALAALIPPAEAELLKRCAAVRTFDAETVEVLRADASSTASLEPLLGLGFTEAVSGADGVFRLRESVRSDHLDRWWSDEPTDGTVPPALVELSRRLVEFYDGRGEVVEALYHLLAADARAGLERFEALYADADSAFDLPRCGDLVDVLGERLRILGPEGAELRNRYRRYLDARGYWIDDWYRTARFLQPRATEAPIAELLRGGYRALQLWARGGIGKTMLVRWLIARRCVPAPERIACARIDFDGVDPVAAVHEPGLVLLELAAQLNQQLRDAPFQELLREYGHYRERLRLRAEAAVSSGFEAAADADDIRVRVGAVLAELPAEERVLLVLDTLEVALLTGAGGRSDALLPLLAALAELHDRAPAVRLILAGRYDLRERVPQFLELFPTLRTLEMAGFEDDEARLYVTEKRGVQPGPILESAVRAARRLPFKLALIADVLDDRPDLTAEEIAEYEDVDVAYLIERVVLRVEDEVQWVLRYGVVPRVLDLPFLREVMRPHLVDAMSGRSTRDRPGDDRLHVRRTAVQPFRTDLYPAERDVDVEELWRALRRYAGTASWVSVDRDDPSLLRFHPDVVEPMRRLVSRHPVFDDLQRDACAYFERKAEADGPRWARWMREAVFHRFQLEGPDAAVYWREQVARAGEKGDIEACRELAAEPAGRDYLDDDGEPRRWWRRRRRIVTRATIAEARFEHAWATVRIGYRDRLTPADPAWTTAAQQLAAAETLQRGQSRPPVTRARLALVRTPLLLVASDFDAARTELDAALRGRLRRDERLWLLVEYADAVTAHDREEAHARLESALELASGEDAAAWRRGIQLRLALQDAAADDLAAALRACDEARAIAPDAAVELLRGDIALRAGDAGVAREAVAAARLLGASEPDVDLLDCRIHLACWDPVRAAAIAERRIAALDELPDAPPEATAAFVELLGDARARLLDVEGALGALVDAFDRWTAAGGRVGAWRALHKRAEFVLRELGDVAEAGNALLRSETAALSAGADAVRATRLLQAEVAERAGEAERAKQLVDEAAATLGPAPAPHEIVEVELVAAAVDPARPLLRLADALARVTPATARLALLEPLERCRPSTAPRDQRERLRRVVPRAGSAPVALALADAELDRVLERRVAATRKLEELRGPCEATAYSRRKWLDAMKRLDEHVRLPRTWRAGAEADAAGAATPLLAAAGVVLGVLVSSGAWSDLLGRARELLDREGLTAGAWRARLHEAVAQAARERGKPAEARRHLELAAEVYAQLGDVAARDRVLGGSERPEPHLHASDDEPAVLVTLALLDRGVAIDVDAPRAPTTRIVSRRDPLTSPLRAAPPAYAKLGAQLVGGWPGFGLELGEILAPAFAEGRPSDPLDVRLRIADVALQAIPWELALGRDHEPLAFGPRVRRLYRTTRSDEPSHEDVRVVQRALRQLGRDLPVDGVLGPATAAALAAFQQTAGLPPTGAVDQATRNELRHRAGAGRTVAVIRATDLAEDRSYRGSSQSGVPIEYEYSSAGYDVRLVPPEDLGRLATQPVTIVHVAAGLTQDASGGVELDFGAAVESYLTKSSAAKARRSDHIGASALDFAFRSMTPKPIVFLDPPAPPTPTETANQLLLRNALAADLFALGNAEAVVALGLARYAAQRPLYDALRQGLAGGAKLGEIADAIRRIGAGSGDVGALLSFQSVALFARRADVALPRER